MKLKISRKEAKETQYWSNLLVTDDDVKRLQIQNEAEEIRKILSTILNKLS